MFAVWETRLRETSDVQDALQACVHVKGLRSVVLQHADAPASERSDSFGRARCSASSPENSPTKQKDEANRFVWTS